MYQTNNCSNILDKPITMAHLFKGNKLRKKYATELHPGIYRVKCCGP